MRILLVEDDVLLGEGVSDGLKQFGFTVDWVQDGVSANQAVSNETFDAIVLDLEIPKKPGFEVLREIRNRKDKTPVLILTANELIESRVFGLDLGADDYMIKPFDLNELCARIRALLRRAADRATPIISYKNIKVDPASHKVHFNDTEIVISRREFALLVKLLETPGRVISRETLMQTLYGWGDDIDSNALEVHIHNLRKKFGSDLVRTIRGVGYMVDKEDK